MKVLDESEESDLSETKLELSRARSLPSYLYTSDEIYNLELERIFYKKWLVAGHISQIAKPGDVMLLDVGSRSVIIARGEDGELRAFHNVCRHRGTRMMTEPRKEGVSTIQCPYHSWGYRLDGTLLACPDTDKFHNFRKEDYPLYPVKLETWGGFIFVNLDPDSEPLSTFLGDFKERFASYRMEEMRWVATIGTYDVGSNWKIIVENTNECYHCPTVHPETLKAYYRDHVPYDDSKIRGSYSLQQWKTYVKANWEKEPWQAESIKRLGLRGDDASCLHLPTTFPNCQFAITPAWCQTLIAWPLGPGRTRVLFEFYAHRWSGSDDDLAEVIKWFDIVNRQDWGICELQQAGFNSGVFQGGAFNELERVVHHFQRLYVQAIDAGLR